MRCTPLVLALACTVAACSRDDPATPTAAPPPDPSLSASNGHGRAGLAEGKSIFRFDTFGDETFWTDTLRMHEVIRTSVSPNTALSVGLKVDADALPEAVKTAIQTNGVD